MAAKLTDFLQQVLKLDDDKPDSKEGLGQKPEFPALDLAISPSCPETEVDDGHIEVKLKFKKPIKTTFKLLFGHKEQDCSRFVFSQTKDDEVIFTVNFPRKGFFKFNLFALDAKDKSQSYPCVFTYLFEVKKASKDLNDFPKQFAPWPTKGCYLYKPLTLDPSKNMDDVKFEVYVPGAKRVAVKAKDEWFHLTEESSRPGVWKGKACLEHYRKKREDVPVRLNAGFDDKDKTSYESLLEYTL